MQPVQSSQQQTVNPELNREPLSQSCFSKNLPTILYVALPILFGAASLGIGFIPAVLSAIGLGGAMVLGFGGATITFSALTAHHAFTRVEPTHNETTCRTSVVASENLDGSGASSTTTRTTTASQTGSVSRIPTDQLDIDGNRAAHRAIFKAIKDENFDILQNALDEGINFCAVNKDKITAYTLAIEIEDRTLRQQVLKKIFHHLKQSPSILASFFQSLVTHLSKNNDMMYQFEEKKCLEMLEKILFDAEIPSAILFLAIEEMPGYKEESKRYSESQKQRVPEYHNGQKKHVAPVVNTVIKSVTRAGSLSGLELHIIYEILTAIAEDQQLFYIPSNFYNQENLNMLVKGDTLLHRAIQDSKVDFANRLLTFGADREARNNSGLTPLAYATPGVSARLLKQKETSKTA